MSISLHDVSAPVFVRMLNNAQVWIEQAKENAEARGYDAENLVGMRLAPDMLPFGRQLQIATDHAKGCVSRLGQVDNPPYADDEKSLEELSARLAKTSSFVDSVPAAGFDGAESREVVIKLPKMELKMDGLSYLNTFAMPNFLFHISTAYGILRKSGVPLGKYMLLAGSVPPPSA